MGFCEEKKRNWPSSEPVWPHAVMKLPLESNFSIRLWLESTTYTLPAASVASPPIGPELAVTAAVGAPLRLERAVGGELLHDVAQLVGDVHVALRVHGDRLGEAQHALGTLADDLRGRVRAGGGTRAGAPFGERASAPVPAAARRARAAAVRTAAGREHAGDGRSTPHRRIKHPLPEVGAVLTEK